MKVECQLQTEELIKKYAALRNIPVSKVMRNAARDFTQAGYRVTPSAKISRSPYARIKNRKGETQFIRIDKYSGKQLRRLNKLRVRLHKGWSKASWIGVFRELGMPSKNPAKKLPLAAQMNGGAGPFGNNGYSLSVHIHFNGFNHGSDRISESVYKAGFANASKRLTKDMARIMKNPKSSI